MKKTLLILIVAILILNLSGCSKTSRFSMRTESYVENTNLTNFFEDVLIKNGHSLSTEVPYDTFNIILKFSTKGYDVEGLIYYLNTGITEQGYEYTGYFCEGNDNNNRLNCYTRKDEIFNRDYLIEQLGFSTILDTINEYEIIDVFQKISEIHSVVLKQDERITITVKYYDNETYDFDSFRGVHYDDGVIQSEGELVLNGYYLQYLYYSPSGNNSICYAYIKMTN